MFVARALIVKISIHCYSTEDLNVEISMDDEDCFSIMADFEEDCFDRYHGQQHSVIAMDGGQQYISQVRITTNNV